MATSDPRGTWQARLAQADPALGVADRLATLDERAEADLRAVLRSPRPAASSTTRSTSLRTTPGTDSRQTRRPPSRLLTAAATVLLLAGAALGAQHLLSRQHEPTAAQLAAYGQSTLDAAAVLDPDAGLAANAAQVAGATSPRSLARLSDVVALGRFERVQAGRDNLVDGEVVWTTTVLVLDDVTVVEGDLPDGADGNLYVEAPLLTGFTDQQTWEAVGIPEGTPVLVYLRTAWDGTDVPGQPPYTNRLADPASGRPAGQPLYEVYYPQGLALQAADDVVVWPAMRKGLPGTLVEALPDGDLLAQW